jgi:hypothetical protein
MEMYDEFDLEGGAASDDDDDDDDEPRPTKEAAPAPPPAPPVAVPAPPTPVVPPGAPLAAAAAAAARGAAAVLPAPRGAAAAATPVASKAVPATAALKALPPAKTTVRRPCEAADSPSLPTLHAYLVSSHKCACAWDVRMTCLNAGVLCVARLRRRSRPQSLHRLPRLSSVPAAQRRLLLPGLRWLVQRRQSCRSSSQCCPWPTS